jgi:hypothetical protein
VLKLFRGQESSHQHEGREPFQSQGSREDWYLQLRGKLRAGEIKNEKTFREVSEHYLREYDIITQGQRNKRYVDGQHWRSSVHLIPFFGNLGISEVTAGNIQEYRVHRHQEAIAKRGKPPGRSTIHQEIVTLRQTLKQRCATDGSTGSRIFPSRTENPQKFPIVRGSHQRNTKSSTKRHESARRNQRRRASTGRRNSCTTLCYSPSILDCDPTRHGALSLGMSRSLMTRIWVRPSGD